MLLSMRGCRLWACTNAGKTHAYRVLNILGVTDCFQGVTFCDYAEPDFACKPDAAFYVKTMKEAGAERVEDCWFVDDSEANVRGALEFGWKCVQVTEEEEDVGNSVGFPRIRCVKELPSVFPEFWNNGQV
jgi:pyrimidine and pyridine-specific 5'-nucleotidase